MKETIYRELKWHIALLLPRLPLNEQERERVWSQLVKGLPDNKESKIVRVNCLQTLYEMKQKFNLPEAKLSPFVKSLINENVPSIRARLKRLQRV